MGAHDISVVHRPGSESMHKDLGLTKKERLSYHDDDEARDRPGGGGDDCFLKSADKLAALPSEERAREAATIAKDYAPYNGPKRARITD